MKFSDLDLDKTYSYADYLQWDFGERVELINGKVHEMKFVPINSDLPLHQIMSMEISGRLWSFLKGNKCKVFSAPFDVRLPRKSKDDRDIVTVLQPDICVVCDLSKLDEKGCIGAPEIVVEILSPGNNSKELKNKYEVYEEAGVKEYWIVSPQDNTFVVYTLVNCKYEPSRIMVAGDVVKSSVLEGFSLDLAELFGE